MLVLINGNLSAIGKYCKMGNIQVIPTQVYKQMGHPVQREPKLLKE